jgi:hypothetical protein
MKVKSEDILRPGVTLQVTKIDFTDPKVKAFVEASKVQQRNILKMRYPSPEKLSQVITL